ncbi:MAG: hypothetical protein O2780_15730 [Proteobacteria bacterium]|jgi:hypothetical protein|nr:hypothetical protein [Pseudomonadota bacterium]MDA1302373.1 hypothetical protein [Pseudomonadota bacterium]
MFRTIIRLLVIVPVWLSLGQVAMASTNTQGADSPRCQLPARAGPVPDGATASKEEMMAAKDMVQTFVSQGQAFLECLSEEIDRIEKSIESTTLVDGQKPQQLLDDEDKYRKLIQIHDSIVTYMQTLAAAFNKAVQDFQGEDE